MPPKENLLWDVIQPITTFVSAEISTKDEMKDAPAMKGARDLT